MEKQPVEKVLEEFRNKTSVLESAGDKTEGLIKQILIEAKIGVHSVTNRVKSEQKLKEKYLRNDKDYKCLQEITDQVGVRITTYYEDQVDPVSNLIIDNFHIYPEHTVDKRKQDPERFSYRSLHHVCSYSAVRASLPEYRSFSTIMIEIQIRSILQHAWAEMEHDAYDLRGKIPAHIRRRFSRLAGLLELADQEFIEVRKQKEQYMRSVSVLIEADALEASAVDVLSIKTFIEQDQLVSTLDKQMSLRLDRPISFSAIEQVANTTVVGAKCANLNTLDDIRKKLLLYKDSIVDFGEDWADLRSEWVSVAGSMVSGFVLAQLMLLLVALRGVDAVAEFATQLGREIVPAEKAEQLIEIAQKYELNI